MSERLVIDPITRIEGHLRIEAQIKDGVIEQAWSTGTMVRGIELILRGRDPRDAWAFAQRHGRAPDRQGRRPGEKAMSAPRRAVPRGAQPTYGAAQWRTTVTPFSWKGAGG